MKTETKAELKVLRAKLALAARELKQIERAAVKSRLAITRRVLAAQKAQAALEKKADSEMLKDDRAERAKRNGLAARVATLEKRQAILLGRQS